MVNKQKVYILSRDEAIKFRTVKNSGVIRVLEPDEEYYELMGAFAMTYPMRFHDVTPSPHLPSNIVYFNNDMAEDLLLIFKEMKKFKEVVFHCHAGISRSPALALSYSWFIGDTDLENDIKSRRIVPNPLVMAIMAKKLGVWEEKKDYILRYAPDTKGERLLETI